MFCWRGGLMFNRWVGNVSKMGSLTRKSCRKNRGRGVVTLKKAMYYIQLPVRGQCFPTYRVVMENAV